MSNIINISPREQALINALKAIVIETMDYPPARPFDSRSYLPGELVDAGMEALADYGVTLKNEVAQE